MSGNITDFHVHPFDGQEYNMIMYPNEDVTDAEGMERQLREAGITHICGSVLNRKKVTGFETLRRLNDEALRLKEKLGDFYTPGFHIHPAYVRESCEEIERMHKRGVRLLGELVPYLHEWGEFPEKNRQEIMDVAAQYGMVCSYHTPFGYPVDKMLREHKGLTFVAAHPGDRQRVAEHIENMKKHENLYLDLSGTGLFRFGMLRYLVEQIGADRIMFGTDYPICNPRMYVEAVYGEEIGQRERELIFHGNAERILSRS